MTYTLSASTSFPYSTVCMVTDVINGTAYRGSAVIIGPHTILTAAHVVWDATTHSQATNIRIFQGYSDTAMPGGSGLELGATALHYLQINDTGGTMGKTSSSYDFAVLDVGTTFSSWFGLQANYMGGTVNATGYPAYPNELLSVGPQSWQQWTASGTVSADYGYNVLDYTGFTLSGGNSGGPLWIDKGTAGNPQPVVVGIASTTGFAGQITSSTLSMIQNWIAGDSFLWTSPAAATAAVSKFVSAENTARQAAGWGTDLEAAGVASGSGTNSVVGWQSGTLPAGNNALVLDGARSQYPVQIDANGQVIVHDSTTGQSIVVNGASYIIFNGASGPGNGTYDQMLFVEGGTNGQDAALARLYQAALGRVPDLAGLEAWKGALDTGQQSMDRIAAQFIGSSEFTGRFGAGTSTGQFVTALYQNVLGRTPDAVGLANWTAALDSGAQTRTQVLQGFANSQECIGKVAGWLVDTTQGGYADSGMLLDAATVLNQAETTHNLNLALVNPATDAGSGNAYGVRSYNGSYYLTSTSITVNASNATVIMSSPQHYGYLEGNSDTLFAASSTVFVSCFGTNEAVTLAPRSTTTVYGFTGSSTTIFNFVPGSDAVSADLKGYSQTGVLLNDSAGQTTNGALLNFQNNLYVLNVGAVGAGSAVEVAAAVNKVYTLAGSAWSSTTSPEYLEVIGQTLAGNTVVYRFGTDHANPDVNGNHLVDAGELAFLATLVGISTSTLTAHDIA